MLTFCLAGARCRAEPHLARGFQNNRRAERRLAGAGRCLAFHIVPNGIWPIGFNRGAEGCSDTCEGANGIPLGLNCVQLVVGRNGIAPFETVRSVRPQGEFCAAPERAPPRGTPERSAGSGAQPDGAAKARQKAKR